MNAGGMDFATWYAAERDGIARSLLLIGGEPELARDALAEAFCRAYERWPKVRAMRSPAGWVYTVALNDLRRRQRRRRLEQRLLGRRHEPPPPGIAVDPDLWAAVAALPTRQREAVVLRYVADQTEKDVAGVLGISEGAVSSTLVAARRTLAARLDDRQETRS